MNLNSNKNLNNKELGADVLKKKLDELNGNVFYKDNQRDKLQQLNQDKRLASKNNINDNRIDNLIGDMKKLNDNLNQNDNNSKSKNINSFINKVKDDTEQNNNTKRYGNKNNDSPLRIQENN